MFYTPPLLLPCVHPLIYSKSNTVNVMIFVHKNDVFTENEQRC